MLRVVDGKIVVPALATAHSHAFQRALRGRAQRAPREGHEDFWSWRQAMYQLVGELDPERLYQVSRVAFEELYAAGIRTVGEFHYLHHQADGTPYEGRTQMAQAVIHAARDEGMRIALLRVVYQRAAPDRPAEGAQRRFVDQRLEDALRDIEDLRTEFAADDAVQIGIAPHSVRAVPPAWLPEIAEFADRHQLPLHMHVAEQPADVTSCVDETGRRPVELLADRGVLGPRFVAVHATHLVPEEAALLGQSRSFVCLCPSTERDLGDGFPDASGLVDAGARLCVGVDSHVVSSPLEELRAVELHERLRTGRRVVLPHTAPSLAEALWEMGSHEGARACGFADAGGDIELDRTASELMLVDDDHLLDAIVFSGTDRLFLAR